MVEIYIYKLEEIFTMLCSAIPVGFLIGCIPVIIGLTISGILRIFKSAERRN